LIPADKRIGFDELASKIAADLPETNVTILHPGDVEFLREIGALDWSLAGSMMFQRMIRQRVLDGKAGALADQDRIRAMRVGYPW